VTQNPFASLESTGGGIVILLLLLMAGLFLVGGEHTVVGAELIGSAVAGLLYLILHK
jgi:hypothetical protein